MLESIPSFTRLVQELAKFPGIGPKTAGRLAFHILKQPSFESASLAEAITDLKEKIRFCKSCFHITEDDSCSICADSERDASLICVVEDSRDLISIEKSRSFRGRYHVLQGLLSPLDGVGPEDLKVRELLERLKDHEVKEVLVATSFTVEGDATALYLSSLIRPSGIRVTRLANGIPLGSDLEYVDEATVHQAVQGRREL